MQQVVWRWSAVPESQVPRHNWRHYTSFRRQCLYWREARDWDGLWGYPLWWCRLGFFRLVWGEFESNNPINFGHFKFILVSYSFNRQCCDYFVLCRCTFPILLCLTWMYRCWSGHHPHGSWMKCCNWVLVVMLQLMSYKILVPSYSCHKPYRLSIFYSV